jgi:hypothetical protein
MAAEEKPDNKILIEVLKDLTGLDFTDIEIEILREAMAADDYYRNEKFYNLQGEQKEIKVITLLKNYRKLKQR